VAKVRPPLGDWLCPSQVESLAVQLGALRHIHMGMGSRPAAGERLFGEALPGTRVDASLGRQSACCDGW